MSEASTANRMTMDPSTRHAVPPAAAPQRRVGQLVRWILPFVVSAAFLAFVLRDVEIREMGLLLTPRVALIFLPALAIFLVVSLLIEAVCIVLVVNDAGGSIRLGTAARVKAASYLLGLLNYALGAGALTVLLRRRAGMALADAAGAVFVIGLFDLGSLLVCVLAGAAMLDAEAPGVRAGVVVGAVGLIVLGFAVLRAPFRLGPIDFLRDLSVFRAARTLPVSLLTKLGLLRLIFMMGFILLAAAILAAFDVFVPPIHLVVNTAIMLLVAALPIAAAGLGTGQIVFVSLFRAWADPETLLAASLTLSFGLIVTRSALGLLFAREFTQEALAASREEVP